MQSPRKRKRSQKNQNASCVCKTSTGALKCKTKHKSITLASKTQNERATLNKQQNKRAILTYKTRTGDFCQFSSRKVNSEISSCLDKNLQAFWVFDDVTGRYFMFDMECMQQHDIRTGRITAIRLETQENINSAKTTAKKPCRANHANKNKRLCSVETSRKLTLVRFLQIQLSPLIMEMAQLPVDQQLFDPLPMHIKDKRFPRNQLKHLHHGGLTVHAVRPTTTWKRHRRYFDSMFAEEQEMFATPEGVPQLKHFAWHGAPAHCIKGILELGFLVGPRPRVGSKYGHGVYLSTESYACYSMHDQFSKPDAAGFKYILLCEVLPGSVEVSKQGQVRPQTRHTHSGVDQLQRPCIHVFFCHDMNVRISPRFVVCIHPEVTADVMARVPNS